MKYLLNYTFVLVFFLMFFSCQEKKGKPKNLDQLPTDIVANPASASGNTNKDNLPQFSFEEEAYDFGKITQGEKVTHSFKFKNTGNSDLIISSASGSCGCTVPHYPKDPIPTGGEGVVDVIFDSEGKQGKQHKTVTLIANTIPNTKVLTITGEIEIKTE